MALAPIWTPQDIKGTTLNTFRLYVNRTYNLSLRTYEDIHNWSVNDISAFAEAVFNFAGINTSTPYTRIADGLDKMFPPPRWFPGALMNYTENIIGPGLAIRPNGVAVTTCEEESDSHQDYTFAELEEKAAVWANALKALGVGKSDRVAAVLPNRIDCLLILLATAAIGAIFSSTSPDMGTAGIVERYSQVRPSVFICDTMIRYGGKLVDLRGRFREVSQKLEAFVPEFKCSIIVNGPSFIGSNVKLAKDVLSMLDTRRITYEQLPFDHPVYILYSSGTTGAPKCITHAAGRALLQQKKELLLGNNVGSNSTLYQYTTTGWMMWNWMIAALSTGARIVLYDGSPVYPSPVHQLDIIKRENVTHWGTSPKFLTALKQHGLREGEDLETLQHVASAGSPLSAELHQWFTAKFPKGVGLFSGSGGTDLVGGIVSGSPISDVYPGEISVPNLGMKVEIWNSEGYNIDHTGAEGDLVITKPFFSMPLCFWGNRGTEKYRAAYFERYPGIWYHGDFIRRNPQTGGYEILGRSDSVLNPGGVRFGSAEIYGIVEKISEVQDCLCIGQKLPPDWHDERVLLFLKLHPGKRLNEQLRSRIRRSISTELSPRHLPAKIFQVRDIPYTVNGKRIENLVRDIVSGKPTGKTITAVNPECLEEYRQFILREPLCKL